MIAWMVVLHVLCASLVWVDRLLVVWCFSVAGWLDGLR